MITRPFAIPALLSLLAALALGACASGVGTPPPGGPADTVAPRIVATDPSNGTLNFSGDEVTITFSEYMQEGTAANSVVVTPIPARQPDFDWSGRRLTISFDEPLLPNRTYAITIGAGMTDLAAPGNRLGQPFTLRFSTGSTIDSGIARGRVAGVERRRAFVFAYRLVAGAPDTLRPEMTRPDFIAPVADDGTFSLEALPPGHFRLLAVTDEYGDQLYSPGVDAFGIASSDVTIDSAYTPVGGIAIRLSPAPLDLVPPMLNAARSIDRTTTELRFSEPIDTATLRASSFTIESSGASVAVHEAWRSTTNRLSIIVAHDQLPTGEATARASDVRDTAGNAIPDSAGTATFTVAETLDTLAPAIVQISVDSAHAYTWPDSVAIAFDAAVRTDERAGAVVLRDTLGRTLAFGLRRISPAQLLAYPLDTLAGAARGVLEIDMGRFTDLAGNRHDSIARIRVPIAAVRQLGSISGTLVDSAAPDASHVVTLALVGTARTFRRTVRSGAWEFTGIPEGEYRVSAFRDENGNGKYDYGAIAPYRGPEPTVEWGISVRVRPRWSTTKVELVFGR
jgi:uncharacterized protein (DUF2141 family)